MMGAELAKIDELLETDVEPGEQLPSKDLIGIGKNFIKTAWLQMKERMPRLKSVTPDYRGGFSIDYEQNGKHLQLIFKPEKVQLFWKEGSKYRQIDISDRNLFISKLVWLKG